MTTERTFTPITPEGLRGLGFEWAEGKSWPLYRLAIGTGRMTMFDCTGLGEGWHVWMTSRPNHMGNNIGTAPDLEWVESMIGLLKRANGEGV